MNRIFYMAMSTLCIASSMAFADVRGYVLDGATKVPISGASMKLKQNGSQAESNAMGFYKVLVSTSALNPSQEFENIHFRLNGSNLQFSVTDGVARLVSISLSDLKGANVFRYVDVLNAGDYSYDMGSSLHNAGTYIMQLKIGNKKTTQKLIVSSAGVKSVEPMVMESVDQRMLKLESVNPIDSLEISKSNYYSVLVPIYSYQDSIANVLMTALSSDSLPQVYWTMKDLCQYDGAAETKYTGYQSESPLNFTNTLGTGMSFSVSVAKDASMNVVVQFANGGTSSRPMTLSIDGVVARTFGFAVTGGWGIWATESQTVSIKAGTHTIAFKATTSDGGANLDYVGTSSNGITKGKCPEVVSSSVISSSSMVVVSSSSIAGADWTLSASVVGFATVDGSTTGGGNATATTVTTFAEFKTAVQDKNPRVVIVSGTIKTTDGGGSALAVSSNKTILGKDKNATIYGGISMSNVSNVIVRNLNMQGIWPNSGPDDAISVRGSNHIWLDHLNIWDAGDGNLDITNASSYVTVSWCKFWYTNASHPHRLNALIGSGGGDHPEDWGYLKVTYHHNWFSTLVNERMPRLMYGQAHVYNNYYTATGNLYCIGVGSYGAALIEGNYFKDVKSPHVFMYDVYCHITAKNNTYVNTTGNKDNGMGGSRKVTGQDFDVVPLSTAPYKYVLDASNNIPNIVGKYAGPQ